MSCGRGWQPGHVAENSGQSFTDDPIDDSPGTKGDRPIRFPNSILPPDP